MSNVKPAWNEGSTNPEDSNAWPGESGARLVRDYALKPEATCFCACKAPVLWNYLSPTESEVRIGKQDSPKRRYAVGDFRLVAPATEIQRAPSSPTVIRAFELPGGAFEDHITLAEECSDTALMDLQYETFRSNSIDFLTQSLAKAEREGAPKFFVQNLAHAIVLEVWRLTKAHTISPVDDHAIIQASGQLCAGTLALIDQYIRDCLEEKIDLDTLAEVAGMQVFSFSRNFKKATGISPYQHVMNVRIDEARALIITTQFSLAEIAYRCGFSSQSHMTDVFSSRVGVSPGRIRNG